MKSDEIRQSFLQFFKGKGHTMVPSSSLLPEAPNLLFTNAGMNPFVPYFLGERTPTHLRVADTQKCIRAGGKHNDLDEVGFDTYHHTFFEMLGNWSFGDFFKREAITWAWELLTKVWGFPQERLYATIYAPEANEPAELDTEARQIWTEIFKNEGLDPQIHIVLGHKKDNFWMMGDTGPCGPCTEIHMDLTPEGNTQGRLVNQGDVRCIEIWNLVFIQYNALPQGQFELLKQHFVDTGMGFERVAGIFATTQNFNDFSKLPSNYDSDLFQPIFEALQSYSGHVYGGQIATGGGEPSPSVMADCAFRILADHSRTLAFAIADGILPGNEGRNYVLRRIVRRGLLFGQKLHLPTGAFAQLAALVVQKMGTVFPELVHSKDTIIKVLEKEEDAFQATLERGLRLFAKWANEGLTQLPGTKAFELYDTYGFPLDLTQLIAQEHHMQVDTDGFNAAMAQQKERSKAAMKKQTVQVSTDTGVTTEFVGYDEKNLTAWSTKMTGVLHASDKTYLLSESSPFYGECGGQVGDQGTVVFQDQQTLPILNTLIKNGLILHEVEGEHLETHVGETILLNVDVTRRKAIARHHSATHLLHMGLMRVLGAHIHQAGSLVNNQCLRFDFSHFEKISNEQLHAVEQWCNRQILSNLPVWTEEVDFDQRPEGCIAFFEDKYGDRVRVVHMGEKDPGTLCGGTHVHTTGELGQIKVIQESGVAAGIRRIEAVAGELAYEHHWTLDQETKTLSQQFSCPCNEIYDKYQSLLEQKKAAEHLYQQSLQKNATQRVLKEEIVDHLHCVQWSLQAMDPNVLRSLCKSAMNDHDIDLLWAANIFEDKGTIYVFCSEKAIQQGLSAQKRLQAFLVQIQGKGGGKPDFSTGGTKDLDLLKSKWATLPLRA